jgi:predicted nucleic acid-binding protein
MDSPILEKEIEKNLSSPAKETVTKSSPEKKENTKNDKGVVILTDTSWLVAILDEKDVHHIAATSSLGALIPYKPYFLVPVLAAAETMSRLIRVNKKSVKVCRHELSDLLAGKLQASGRITKLDFNEILTRYESWSRKKIKNMTAIDFFIVTEGIAAKAKILTCDLKMYSYAKKYYHDIYFMTDQTSAKESDLGRLIQDIQTHK